MCLGEGYVCFHSLLPPHYWQFLGGTSEDIMTNYPSNNYLVTAARVALFFTLLFSYPVLLHPTRSAVNRLCFYLVELWESKRAGLQVSGSLGLVAFFQLSFFEYTVVLSHVVDCRHMFFGHTVVYVHVLQEKDKVVESGESEMLLSTQNSKHSINFLCGKEERMFQRTTLVREGMPGSNIDACTLFIVGH